MLKTSKVKFEIMKQLLQTDKKEGITEEWKLRFLFH